jgi:predicted nucleotidyltransferase
MPAGGGSISGSLCLRSKLVSEVCQERNCPGAFSPLNTYSWVSAYNVLMRCVMSVPIDDKLEEIAATCQRYGIERLFVFGSALRDDFKPGESDIDLLVEFGPLEITKRFHVFLDAREAFRNIFQADVDLVMQGAVKNKIIANEIDRTKKLVYGA